MSSLRPDDDTETVLKTLPYLTHEDSMPPTTLPPNPPLPNPTGESDRSLIEVSLNPPPSDPSSSPPPPSPKPNPKTNPRKRPNPATAPPLPTTTSTTAAGAPSTSTPLPKRLRSAGPLPPASSSSTTHPQPSPLIPLSRIPPDHRTYSYTPSTLHHPSPSAAPSYNPTTLHRNNITHFITSLLTLAGDFPVLPDAIRPPGRMEHWDRTLVYNLHHVYASLPAAGDEGGGGRRRDVRALHRHYESAVLRRGGERRADGEISRVVLGEFYAMRGWKGEEEESGLSGEDGEESSEVGEEEEDEDVDVDVAGLRSLEDKGARLLSSPSLSEESEEVSGGSEKESEGNEETNGGGPSGRTERRDKDKDKLADPETGRVDVLDRTDGEVVSRGNSPVANLSDDLNEISSALSADDMSTEPKPISSRAKGKLRQDSLTEDDDFPDVDSPAPNSSPSLSDEAVEDSEQIFNDAIKSINQQQRPRSQNDDGDEHHSTSQTTHQLPDKHTVYTYSAGQTEVESNQASSSRPEATSTQKPPHRCSLRVPTSNRPKEPKSTYVPYKQHRYNPPPSNQPSNTPTAPPTKPPPEPIDPQPQAPGPDFESEPNTSRRPSAETVDFPPPSDEPINATRNTIAHALARHNDTMRILFAQSASLILRTARSSFDATFGAAALDDAGRIHRLGDALGENVAAMARLRAEVRKLGRELDGLDGGSDGEEAEEE
ncbi:hypothetical protein BU24DRAFT_467935 [Aaosphaeria arxii CBS 175.79]|uniref:Uncharacterized protein n=1 Tax=Aaosphaeria arxii CBS 175.79 TaxID=1450172 RepID=A0A6A5X9Y6_9PLEO|nr:uncharacterized protein BU24DRAFT_467935 [Aaosphaeria arxii CBS 175.79]KAF2009574.1 hypothetical protein BU24DRAFT_467935 [Aaosphaeria arxii CBS 175.79]